jgi:drug/metabolite transporter (DMT)-like permease
MALWINYKKQVFKALTINFVIITQVFFEMQANIGASVLLFFSLLAVRKIDDIFLNFNKRHIFLSCLSGISIFLSQVTFCLGLKTSDAAFTAPWMLLNPNFVTIFAILLKLEENGKLKLLGVATSMSGTIGLIFAQRQEDQYLKAMIPFFFLFFSSVSNAIGIIIWRFLMVKSCLSPTVVTTWSLTVASVFMTIAFFTEPFWWMDFQDTRETFKDSVQGCALIINCCFLIMLGYALSYLTMAWATRRASISLVALYTSARPIFTVVQSFIIHQDSFEHSTIACLFFLLVLLGLLLSSYSKKKEKNIRIQAHRSLLKSHLMDSFTFKPSENKENFKEIPEKILFLT